MAIRVLYPMIGNTLGGSHISTFQLIAALDGRVESQVALHDVSGKISDHINQFDDVSHIFYPRSFQHALKHPLKVFLSILKGRRYLKRNAIDIVHCDDGVLRLIWFFSSLFSGVAYVHVQHTLVSPSIEKSIFYPLFSYCVACSQAVAKTMPKTSKLKVIYPCIDFEPYPKSIAKDIDGIFIANMRAQKRPFIFLNMVKQLTDKYPTKNFKFNMVGDFYDEIEKNILSFIEQHNLNDHINIIAFSDEIPLLLARSKILIAPAVGDAFGRTLIEAMASYTVVVAADSGGHQEIVNDGVDGILVEEDNIETFSLIIDQLLNDESERLKISQSGKKRADQFLDTHHIAMQFIDVYQELSN